MEAKEKIPVFIRTVKGKTVCVCHAERKGCKRNCQKDLVERDRFRGWKDIMHRDKYGK